MSQHICTVMCFAEAAAVCTVVIALMKTRSVIIDASVNAFMAFNLNT